ncbi:MAG: protein-L-isoaspartate O-methyltransferase, partial [Octadecabacter sp.]
MNAMSTIAERQMQFLFALRTKGVTDARVLTAMEKTDRAMFVKGHFSARAYEDMPLPIACGQTISQPSVVGLMTQALNVQPRDKVLEVGTGSGYQAAILSHLARRVYTVDRHKTLMNNARLILQSLDITNLKAFTADGSLGLPAQAPFDR